MVQRDWFRASAFPCFRVSVIFSSMRAEIISVGTELLLGQIVDTNAAYLAQRLAEVGIDVYFKQTVGDNSPRVQDAVQLAISRADVILITGGLGPTEDDLTVAAVATARSEERRVGKQGRSRGATSGVK